MLYKLIGTLKPHIKLQRYRERGVMKQVGMRWGLGAARVDLSLLRKFCSKVSAAAAAPFADAAAVQSSSTPWLMLPPGLVGDLQDHEHNLLFSVATKKVIKIKKYFGIPWRRQHFFPQGDIVCLGTSPYGWQAFVNKRTCNFFLFNPLGNPLHMSHTFIPLPPVESIWNCVSSHHRRKIISTTATTQVIEVDSEYNILGGGYKPHSSECVVGEVIDKLVLSSPPLFTTGGEDGYKYNNEDCIVMARATGLDSSCCSRFVWCRPGDTAWTSLNDGGYPFTDDADFTYFSHSQLFYSLSNSGVLESWDVLGRYSKKNVRSPVHNSLPPELQPTMDEHQIQLRTGHGRHRDYKLVESCSELLLVVRYSRWFNEHDDEEEMKKPHTDAYDVYKFDFERNSWVYVPNLGNDRVLFLDDLNSFSVSLSDSSGLISGNSIYLSNGKVYNLDDGGSTTTFLPQHRQYLYDHSPSKDRFQPSHYTPMWIYPPLYSQG